MVAGNGKTLSEVMRDLEAIPFRPRPLGGRTSTCLGFAADALPMLLDTRRTTACKLYPYPRSFRSVTFPSLDGTPWRARWPFTATAGRGRDSSSATASSGARTMPISAAWP